ncbi:LpqB family beta-propeller domain-containing protein [Modestobacter sp. SYSU DS0657]
MTARRRWTALVSLLAVLVLAGCNTVPSSSPTVRITQVPQPPRGDVGVEPFGPVAGATPEEVVRGFIEASASPTRNHPVARQYLTTGAAESWSDADGITIISRDYAAVRAQPGTVEVTAAKVGTVDQRGVFTVAGDEQYNGSFTLVQEEGEWRITDPPGGLVMLQPDFERTYDQLDAFFLDPTFSRVVPDPRYLVSGDAQYNLLVERLLSGPSPTIAAGVENPLAGAQLRSAVEVSGQTATVDLTWPDRVSDTTLEAAAGQLVWTLVRAGLGAVEVRRDGQPLGIPGLPVAQTTDDWVRLDPDYAPADAVGHYLAGGALRRATDGEPVPGPAGAGAYGLQSAAITTDREGALGLTAGVSTSVNPMGAPATLFAGPYGGEMAPVLGGPGFTPPTTAGPRAEVWTVRDGTEVVRLAAGGAPQTVSATTLAGLGRATAFQLSPDGVRAAVVIEGPDGGRLYVGTVVRDEEAVSVRDLRSITPSLREVTDVAWRNAGVLVVLAADAGEERAVPWSVDVDGWALTALATAGLPADRTGLAAAPGRPLLVSADGTIWQLISGTWVTPIRSAGPLAGGAPFYPL